MKLTKSKLKQIIKEELTSILGEEKDLASYAEQINIKADELQSDRRFDKIRVPRAYVVEGGVIRVSEDPPAPAGEGTRHSIDAIVTHLRNPEEAQEWLEGGLEAWVKREAFNRARYDR